MTGEQFTLHRRLWRLYRRLPRLARIWIVLAALGAIVKLAFLSGATTAQDVRAAVLAAVHEATGPSPASVCSAFSPAGLSQLLAQFGGDYAATGASDELAACQQLVPRLRAQATPQQLSEFAGGSVRSVQFQNEGSALVIYAAADGRLGAELTMSQGHGRWFIDSVDSGTIEGAE